jgi:tetratricopeptide (TPR) repeat protein
VNTPLTPGGVGAAPRPSRGAGRPVRRRRVAVLVLALLAMGAAGGGAFLWAQYHLRAAEWVLARYSLDEAQGHLDLCLRVRFASASVRLLAARTARRRDAYDEAERHLEACERLGGEAEGARLERVLLTAQEGDLDDMEGLLKARTAADGPEAALVLEALAKGYANRFWHAEALACADRLLRREPDHPQAWLLRARAREALADGGEEEGGALHDYEKAVELRPSGEARLGLARALYHAGRPWEAALRYEKVRRTLPAAPEVLLGLARCRFALHETDEARRLLDELLAWRPDHADALAERGRLAYREGQAEEAEGWLRRAATAAPAWDCVPHRLLYQYLRAAQKDEEAGRWLGALRAREAEALRVDRLVLQTNRDPGNLALRFEAALALMRLGRERDGVAGLFVVLEQDPRHGPAHAALADYFERAGQPRRAARHRRAGAETR